MDPSRLSVRRRYLCTKGYFPSTDNVGKCNCADAKHPTTSPIPTVFHEPLRASGATSFMMRIKICFERQYICLKVRVGEVEVLCLFVTASLSGGKLLPSLRLHHMRYEIWIYYVTSVSVLVFAAG